MATTQQATRAPGKAMLIGEYAVLDGAPAVVAAVDCYAVARLGAGEPGSPFITCAVSEAAAALAELGVIPKEAAAEIWAKGKWEVERIDEIVMSASDMKEAGEMLESLESEAIARLDAKSANGRVVLGSLSVARHSVAYWSVRADLEEKGASAAKMRWWKWLLVAAADVGGYALSHDVGAAASVSDVAHDWLDSP